MLFAPCLLDQIHLPKVIVPFKNHRLKCHATVSAASGIIQTSWQECGTTYSPQNRVYIQHSCFQSLALSLCSNTSIVLQSVMIHKLSLKTGGMNVHSTQNKRPSRFLTGISLCYFSPYFNLSQCIILVESYSNVISSQPQSQNDILWWRLQKMLRKTFSIHCVFVCFNNNNKK